MSRFLRQAKSLMDTTPSAKGPRRRESSLEHRARKERKFDETESSLPDIKLNIASVTDNRPPIATNLLSYLGSWNPLPLDVTSDSTIWLLDNTAHRSPTTNNWEAEFVVAVFDKGTGVEVSTVVADLAEKLGVGSGDAAEARIRDRLIPFMLNILPGRSVKINFAGKQEIKLGPGGRNGISSDVKQVSEFRDGEIVETTAVVPQGANGILQMSTAFAEPEGWAVLSGKEDQLDR